MFGQASARWPTSIALGLMVALFGVHLNSDLYLASPVTHNPGHSNDMTSAGSHHNSDPSIAALNCVLQQHMKDFEACCEKAKKEDFSEISNENCSEQFANYQCEVSTYCAHCNKGDTELVLKQFAESQEKNEKMKEKCKEWESKIPKVPSTCGGQRSGDASDKPSYLIYIIVVVVLVVAVVIAVVVYCLMCAGDSKGNSAKPGKSSKGSKSMKAGKSTKSGIKGGKSTKSAKSAKSGKSLKGGKSTKSKKSTKSSKGGKSAKK